MKALHAGFLGLACGLAANVVASSNARADETLVVASTPEAASESSSALPNRSLLRSGVFTLAVSYVPALVVAIESDHPADEHLYAPVVGPWLDLADRGDDCQGECEGETVNKVLLVTDGIFQGIGALQILGSLLFPETRTGVTISNSDGTPAVAFTVMPANISQGSGLLAMGEF